MNLQKGFREFLIEIEGQKYLMISKDAVDEEYLGKLEAKLQKLKSKSSCLDAKEILNQLSIHRAGQFLFTDSSSSTSFASDLIDEPISPSYLRLKIAPQTAALNKEELLKLLKSDQLDEGKE
uniref:ADF-H domain-containing protein n=1 Tax=Syphacia muris TaxID=451379 RepID=A0A0N5AE73_9BILA